MKKTIILLFSVFALNQIMAQDVTQGLIGHWPFNGNVNDSIGNYDGTGSGIWYVNDRHGNTNGAVHFSSNDYISIPSIPTSSKITFAFWMKIDQSQNDYGVFIDYGSRRVIVNFAANSTILRFWGHNSGNQGMLSPQGRDTLSLNTWHHIVATLDWDNKVASYYVNGANIMTNQVLIGTAPATGGSVFLGAENGAYYYVKNGQMDDLKIYNRILSSSEVTQLYNYIPTQSNNNTNLWTANGNDTYYDLGNVGIGITSPTEKLEVNGTVRSKKVKVEASGWPDYVFYENYELRDLIAVQAFIKKEGHLPEVPSAKEVETNGLDLGSMDATLLKKVEELTLYLIEQNKRLEKLEKENGSLKSEIQKLKRKN